MMANRRLPVAGDLIAGKYAIVKVLGEGGMGVVYEAQHQRLRQRVAIKMLLPTMLDAVVVERFEREARAAARLASRHVTRVIDVDSTADGMPYMVMEFLQGHDLQREIDQRGKLTTEEAVDYILQACAAMNEAHAYGIVHRDLKPSNLFLAHDGEMRIVKVLDFGISKVAGDGDARLTGAETVMGTAMYMSPEQVKASGSVDQRADIWALGVILYEMLAGRAPFEGTPTQVAAQIVTERAPDVRNYCLVPTEIAAIVERALEMKPQDRFANVRELAQALAPHAPVGSVGRAIGEAIGSGLSGSYPRVSAMPNGGTGDSAATVLQAGAVSQSGGKRDGGTTPGWSQHKNRGAKSSAMLIGMVAAFIGGTIVLCSGAYLFLRSRAPAASVSAAVQSATPPPTADPLPPTIDPKPPETAASPAPVESAPKPVASATAAKPHPARPGASTTAAAKPAAPPPSAPPKPTANPLLL